MAKRSKEVIRDNFLNTSCRVCDQHIVLIVGEGNFSFAKQLVRSVNTQQFYATSLDPKEKIYLDPDGFSNVEYLNSRDNVTVLHNVDATQLCQYFENMKFCSVIFNFPHVGGKSHIKNCQKLLCNFFVSASQHLCASGKICVSLCKGQGGTPYDYPRRIYKNSWMVVTQAARAGLVLTDCLPFDLNDIQYTQAGYRGQLKKNFLVNDSLIHILEKGFPLEHRILSSFDNLMEWYRVLIRSSIGATDSFKFLTGVINNAISYHMWHIFGRFDLADIESMGVDLKDSNCLFVHSGDVKRILPSIMSSKNQGHHSYWLFDESAKFLPCSHPISHHNVFWTNVSENANFFADLLKGLQFILPNNLFKISDCFCQNYHVSQCKCLNSNSPLCFYFGENSTEQYDSDNVPDFITDLSPFFWQQQTPEITVSSINNENGSLMYNQCNHQAYQLNELEKRFFNLSDTTMLDDVDISSKKITVDDICIASIHFQNSQLVLIIHSNELLFSLYNVVDLRYIWSNDKVFSKMLIGYLIEDLKLNHIQNHKDTLPTTIKHPLCFRHDLCFWVDDAHSEAELVTAVRLICRNLIHSMRLLKILRHEENECVSYCYRMIYSSVDGALSHDETVEIQNKLRIQLLQKGFQLR